MKSLAIVFCFAAAVFGQADRGAISGTVLDPLGERIAEAPVQAKNAQTGVVVKATSSAAGKYTLADLPAGSYDLSVNVPGLKPFQQRNVAVGAAKTVALEIKLEDTTQLSTLGEDRLAIAANARKHKPPAGPAPRNKEGKPDLSGVWWSPVTIDPGKPIFQAWAEKVAKERTDNNRKDSPQTHCLPAAVLRLGPLYQFVQSKDYLVEISDDDSPGFHQIYLDGREHPKDPNPAWYGDNVGRWEGDTLIVDRLGFDKRLWLDQELH